MYMYVGTTSPMSQYRDKSMTLVPGMIPSMEVLSEGSSTSDDEKRRSGSVERHHHSPDHMRGSVVSDCVCDTG